MCAVHSFKNWVEAGVESIPNGAKFNTVGSRVYVVNEKWDKYLYLNLNNKQISFEVDISGVGCGYNAAGYTTAINKKAKIGEVRVRQFPFLSMCSKLMLQCVGLL